MQKVRSPWFWIIVGGIALLVSCTLLAHAYFPELVYWAFFPALVLALVATMVMRRTSGQREENKAPPHP